MEASLPASVSRSKVLKRSHGWARSSGKLLSARTAGYIEDLNISFEEIVCHRDTMYIWLACDQALSAITSS